MYYISECFVRISIMHLKIICERQFKYSFLYGLIYLIQVKVLRLVSLSEVF